MDLSLPKVTVYITNFNYARFIDKAIQSVISQTYSNIELIVIDDGSTDNSNEVLAKYVCKDNINIVFQENKGLNRTNNIALRMAQGEFIMRLDADDFLAPDAVEKMVAVFRDNDELGLVFPDYYYVDLENHIIGREIRHRFTEEVTLFDQPAHGACTLIRTEYLKHLGGYNEDYSCQDGYDLWLRFIALYKVANINEPLFYYRIHPDSLSKNEKRILSTRRLIKASYVNKNFGEKKHSVFAIMPLRIRQIGEYYWPLEQVNGLPIYYFLINDYLKSSTINKLIVTTSSHDIITKGKSLFAENQKVAFIYRKHDFERMGVSLNPTINLVINYPEFDIKDSDIMVTCSPDYPFVGHQIIDEAVQNIQLFNADSVVSVRPDYANYYKHSGGGLVPVLDQQKFSKYERDLIYKYAGGIMVTIVKNYKRNKSMLSGRISHVAINQLESFHLETTLDYEMFKVLKDTCEIYVSSNYCEFKL
jgi:glycosyltransferase involved in cell wall biosynthesis